MPSPSHYALFIAAAVTLLVIPGPSVLYVVGRSVARGRAAGVASVLGIHVGSLVHVTAAVIGLSSLLVASAVAFGVVKYAGAAYLIVIGIRRLLGRDGENAGTPVGAGDLRRDFRRGIVVNVLNPKTALFFLAFLPQFVDPNHGHVAVQVLALGLTFVLLGLMTDSTWAFVAGGAGERLRASASWPRIERWVSGSLFVGLGVVAAATGERR
jgi:threonine/homoserine/homoserine lactone efflux protein